MQVRCIKTELKYNVKPDLKALDLVLRFILALFLYIEHFLQARKMQVLSKSAIVCIQLFHSYTKQYCTRPVLLN